MHSLHRDPLGCIFSWFDPITVAVGRCVCKRWLTLLPKSSGIFPLYSLAQDPRIFRLPFLEWAFPQPGCSLHGHMCRHTYFDDVCEIAAQRGNLEVLKWLHARGHFIGRTTASIAASGQHYDILEYLLRQNCPWDSDCTTAVATAGNLPLLIWLVINGCNLSKEASAGAARFGHVEVLEYLQTQRCLRFDLVLYEAIREEQIEVLNWAFDRNTFLSIPCGYLYDAIIYNRRAVMKWLHQHNHIRPEHRSDPVLTELAAKHGRRRMLRWLRKRKFVISTTVTLHAATEGHLHMLQWLRRKKCHWNREECILRAHPDVLPWIQQNTT